MQPMSAPMGPMQAPQQPGMDMSQLPPQMIALLQMLAQSQQGGAPAGPPEAAEGGRTVQCPQCGAQVPC